MGTLCFPYQEGLTCLCDRHGRVTTCDSVFGESESPAGATETILAATLLVSVILMFISFLLYRCEKIMMSSEVETRVVSCWARSPLRKWLDWKMASSASQTEPVAFCYSQTNTIIGITSISEEVPCDSARVLVHQQQEKYSTFPLKHSHRLAIRQMGAEPNEQIGGLNRNGQVDYIQTMANTNGTDREKGNPVQVSANYAPVRSMAADQYTLPPALPSFQPPPLHQPLYIRLDDDILGQKKTTFEENAYPLLKVAKDIVPTPRHFTSPIMAVENFSTAGHKHANDNNNNLSQAKVCEDGRYIGAKKAIMTTGAPVKIKPAPPPRTTECRVSVGSKSAFSAMAKLEGVKRDAGNGDIEMTRLIHCPAPTTMIHGPPDGSSGGVNGPQKDDIVVFVPREKMYPRVPVELEDERRKSGKFEEINEADREQQSGQDGDVSKNIPQTIGTGNKDIGLYPAISVSSDNMSIAESLEQYPSSDSQAGDKDRQISEMEVTIDCVSSQA